MIVGFDFEVELVEVVIDDVVEVVVVVGIECSGIVDVIDVEIEIFDDYCVVVDFDVLGVVVG